MIRFVPLKRDHFSLLHKWMNSPHVAKWWDEKKSWSLEEVVKEYETYVEGYEIVGEKKKPIYAYVIHLAGQPIGYIQYYHTHDFPLRSEAESSLGLPLPKSLASVDLYIGETRFTAQGLGPMALKRLIQDHIAPEFSACLVDPETENTIAIRAYEKIGFSKHLETDRFTLMIKEIRDDGSVFI